MSLTTLYREGTDLDELLAELDSRYPGSVRVVEVTHPREGGVLGFFAKERIGVHYRLVDSAGVPEAPPAAPSIGGETVGYDDVRVARSAEAPRTAVARDGFGPDAAAIRAALAQRVSVAEARTASTALAQAAATTTSPPAGTAAPASSAAPLVDDSAEDVRPAVATASATATRTAAAAPAPGMAFAQILAELAIRKATAASSPAKNADSGGSSNTGAEPNHPAALTESGSDEASADLEYAGFDAQAPLAHTAVLPQVDVTTRPIATPERGAAAFAAAKFIPFATPTIALPEPTAPSNATTAAEAIAADAMSAAGPASETFTGAAEPPVPTQQRRRARAVPQFSATVSPTTPQQVDATNAAAAAAADTAANTIKSTAQPAFTALPRVSSLTGAEAVRPGPLSWPLAVGATCESENQMSADGTRHAATNTAVLTRPSKDAAETVPSVGVSMRDAQYQLSGESSTSPSTPLTLRRQLLELGVPVDRVPTDAVHAYAAIETLVRGLSPAPDLPTGPGQILVVAGCARDVVAAADLIVAGNPGTFETTWTFGCPATLGTRRVPTTENVIASPRHAVDVAAAARKSTAGPILVVIATDTSPPGTASDVAAALEADSVWAAVDATRKPADTRQVMRSVGGANAIVVANAEHSASPATVWELGLPIALLDGRPSTEPSWAVLLLGKLSELEESACSSALC